MQNGIFGLGQGIANAPNRYAEESDRFGMQGQQLRQQAAGLGAPQMQAPNPWVLAAAMLAAAFDKSGQAGQQIAGGIQQGQQRNYENAFRANEAQRQGMLQQAEGFDLQARRADQRLGRFQDASQFAQGQALKREDRNLDQQRFDQKQAADTAQWWAQEGNRRREFQTKEKNDLEAIRLRGDAGEKAAALKTLRDPKSTVAARAEAMDALEDRHGYVFGPDQRKGYLESTYYQKGAEAGTAGKIATTGLTNERAKTERELRDERKANLVARRKNLEEATRLLDPRLQDQIKRTDAYLKSVTATIQDKQVGRQLQASGQQLTARGQDLNAQGREAADYRAALSQASAQVKRIGAAKTALEKQLPKMPDGPQKQDIQTKIRFYDVALADAKNDYATIQKKVQETPKVEPFNPFQGTITPTGTKLTPPSRPAPRQAQRAQTKKPAAKPKTGGTTKQGNSYRIVG